MKTKTYSLLLLVSLTLNALLGGFIIARALRRHARDEGPTSPMHFSSGPHLLRRLVGAAGGPREPRFREIEGAGPREFRAFRFKMQNAQAQVGEALRAEPFSHERFESAVRALEVVEIEGIRGANELAVELAPKLTPSERAEASLEHRTPRLRR